MHYLESKSNAFRLLCNFKVVKLIFRVIIQLGSQKMLLVN